jgi:hypothetical protein
MTEQQSTSRGSTGTAITTLRRGGGVVPGAVLSGPLRAVALQWLDPGQGAEITAEGTEHALYVTGGDGQAAAPGTEVPLAEGTALALPLGTATILTAGSEGLEYFHAVLAVPAAALEGEHHDRHH